MIDNYEQELFEHFIRCKDFSRFKRAIACELSKYSIHYWTYSALDVPIELAIRDCVGNTNPELKKQYLKEAFYECDLLMRHVNQNNEPLYLSDIDAFLQTCPINTREIERNKNLIALNRKLGYKDSYCIPIGNRRNGNRALFSVTTATLDTEDFKILVASSHKRFSTIGSAINSVGIINFPEQFIKSKNELEKFVFSQPFNLMTTMIKYDLTVAEVAERFNIKPDTAKKQLIKARKALGAKTYAGAFAIAIRQGIIDLDCNYIPQ